MEIIKVLLTSLLSVGALFVITKIMGHKQVSELDFFDYVCGITIGSIGAELATDIENPIFPLVALITYAIASLLLALIARKIPRSRKYINGTPSILLDGGKLYRENLRAAKLDLSEFMLLCREAGYFNLDEIETAVFESNGKISILPKANQRPTKPSDFNIAVKEAKIGCEIIMDGRILGENLRRLGKDERWLGKRLASEGFLSESEILLGIYHSEDDFLRLFPIN